MTLTNQSCIITIVLILTISFAEAKSIQIDCRKEVGSRLRSKATIEASGIPRGKYYAKVRSPGGSWSRVSKPQSPVGGHLRFEFDSNPEEIGKTLIPEGLIVNNQVEGVIRKFRLNGQVLPSLIVDCEEPKIKD